MINDLMEMTLSLNALLGDIYGTEKRISGILADLGIEQKYIDELKGEKLSVFYENIKFALECRFLHYSGGDRLLNIICRRYGLFGCKKESLDEIGDSLGVSRERVRQLQNKALKRLVGGVSADATGILLLLCACRVLHLDVREFLKNNEGLIAKLSPSIDDISSETAEEKDEDIAEQIKPLDLTKTTFYISSSFDYVLGQGKYRMLMECGDYRKYIENQNLEGHSDVNMILLAVIEGLEMLRKPSDVTVYSNTLFGVSNIYKRGTLRKEVSRKASNYELKEKIRGILEKQGHYLSNMVDDNLKSKLTEYKALENTNSK